ncbi:MAG: hypothetical protein NXI00_08675 [Cytophagales bacterium]|nr:hypothetical protein [Cytophagales bacterium]
MASKEKRDEKQKLGSNSAASALARLCKGKSIILFLVGILTLFYFTLNRSLILTELKLNDVSLKLIIPNERKVFTEHDLVQIEASPNLTFMGRSLVAKSFGKEQVLDLILIVEGQNLAYKIINPSELAGIEITNWSLFSKDIFIGFRERVDLSSNKYQINSENIKLVVLQTSDTLAIGKSAIIKTPLISL